MLHQSVKTNDLERTETLIKIADVNHVDVDGKFPLYHAWENNQISQIQFLCKHGADVNIKYLGSTILFLECRKVMPNKELIKILMDNNADPNIVCDGMHVIYIACNTENISLLSLLLSYPRTNINTQTQSEKSITPLRHACAYKKNNIVALLMDKNADPNIVGHDKISPLMRTIEYSNNDTCAILLSYNNVDANLKNIDGDTALHIAVIKNNIRGVCLLIKYGVDHTIKNNKGLTAFEQCNEIEIKLLLEQYAKIKEQETKNIGIKFPPLAYFEMFSLCHFGKVSIVKAGSKFKIFNNGLGTWSEYLPFDGWFDAKCEYVPGNMIEYHSINVHGIIFRVKFDCLYRCDGAVINDVYSSQ